MFAYKLLQNEQKKEEASLQSVQIGGFDRFVILSCRERVNLCLRTALPQ